MAIIIRVPRESGEGWHWLNVDAVDFIEPHQTDYGKCTVHLQSGVKMWAGVGAAVLAQAINERKFEV
jgi:hypothetical protein